MKRGQSSKTSATNLNVSSLDQDTVLLARLGHKQGLSFPNTNDRICLHGYIDTLEIRRDFTPLEVFGIGFNIIELIPSLA